MKHIQNDVSDAALVIAIRANMSDFFRHVSRSILEEGFENKKFTRWYSPLPHPWFNGVLSSAQFEEADDAFVEETIQHFGSKQVDTFTWWMEPPLKPSDWEPVLTKHGFGYSDSTPGMAVELQALKEPAETVPGLEVRVVADKESLHDWVKVFVNGYGLPSNWKDIVYNLWLALGIGFPMRNYLAYLNGEPVATSTVFYGGGVAGIYCVATLPEARGKGIGAAVTLKPLHNARELGYAIGVLQSSELGFNVYKRLGFRHLCQIENFYLKLT
jgi:ribosomal protein S18 acetylase RimI-like enzyme